MRWRPLRPSTLRQDGVAGLVLGVQSVPDGLATGLLAGVNPLSGLYAYMVGTFTGALVTSSAFMAIQGTGAMAMIVADVPQIHGSGEPARALFTLTMLTGVVMLVAGLLKLGSVLRFVSNAVMVGFINAVGVNIILGQLASFTGYESEGPNRVVRAVTTFLDPTQLNWPTIAIGVATIALIIGLERTRLGPMGLVVAVVLTSAAALLLGWDGVATLNDLTSVPNSLPLPQAPMLSLIPVLLLPAVSLAFVGLVQGASISSNYLNPNGQMPDASRDFTGQGVANIAAGAFQGMPVGGSVSASAINKAAGARSRQSLLIAGLVMAVVIVAFAGVVGYVAMPALAGLLMLIGYRTINPGNLAAVWRIGAVQRTVMVVTFALTLILPLQYAVVIGVGLSVVLYVVRRSNKISVTRQIRDGDGHLVEIAPDAVLPAQEVVILQPYGSLFFAAAPVFESLLPAVDSTSRGSVVILRLRGREDLGSTVLDVLGRYAQSLAAGGSRLVLVSTNRHLTRQLKASGLAEILGPDGVYEGNERVGEALRRAETDAVEWISRQRD